LDKKPGLLVKVRGDGGATLRAAGEAGGPEIERILTVPARRAGSDKADTSISTWLRLVVATLEGNPWNYAHALLSPERGFDLGATAEIEMVEPDIEQQWPYANPDRPPPVKDLDELCKFDGQNGDGGRATGPGVAWNLGEDYSGLSKASNEVGSKSAAIIIAHLDTGYDPNHITLPANLLYKLQHNFVDKDYPDSAVDRTPSGSSFFRNRGHGTGTLSLLAGNVLDGQTPDWPGYKEAVGGAPLAGIMPVRIADRVVRLSTSTVVQGIEWARQHRAHVLSMSMGGLASQILADAVNLAYDDGLMMVTAAGNNFASAPMPRSIVFPARYRRVLAACGVMADGRAYAGLDPGTMQGNYGPDSKMDTALGAYTPNVPWAQIDCPKVVDMDGAGTSAATPQIAAAAALWLAEYRDMIKDYEPWRRVEAVRYALARTADHKTPHMDAAETFKKIGGGVMRADRALRHPPSPNDPLKRSGEAEGAWAWLASGLGKVDDATGYASVRRAMFGLELTQMAQMSADVEAAIADPDEPAEKIPSPERRRYLQAALDRGSPSTPLRRHLEALLRRWL
jgi:hypothetical protein